MHHSSTVSLSYVQWRPANLSTMYIHHVIRKDLMFWINDFFGYVAQAKLSDGSEVTVLVDRTSLGIPFINPGTVYLYTLH